MAAGDSKTSICNIGLIAIGQDPIVSLTDNSKAAILCNARYDQIRRDLLRAHPWNFAKKQAQIAASSTSPLLTYANAYPLPSDFLRMANLPDNDLANWEIFGTDLYTDETAPLGLVYIYDCEDPTKFDANFTAALGLSIGAELAVPMAQDSSLRETCLKSVAEKMAGARLSGSQENSPLEWDEDICLRARR